MDRGWWREGWRSTRVEDMSWGKHDRVALRHAVWIAATAVVVLMAGCGDAEEDDLGQVAPLGADAPVGPATPTTARGAVPRVDLYGEVSELSGNPQPLIFEAATLLEGSAATVEVTIDAPAPDCVGITDIDVSEDETEVVIAITVDRVTAASPVPPGAPVSSPPGVQVNLPPAQPLDCADTTFTQHVLVPLTSPLGKRTVRDGHAA